ncbi:hypothetical protein FGO68_gene8505 [Halteria grandinella]|uniref:Uncharacterized protein n=1 Tax=Halteria grandinella TaxID=5974 RepID=A0A8J8NG68_HALGN|nr:hypothetical protein FGO68_gene8505 [Halteria grandinella]
MQVFQNSQVWIIAGSQNNIRDKFCTGRCYHVILQLRSPRLDLSIRVARINYLGCLFPSYHILPSEKGQKVVKLISIQKTCMLPLQ